MSCGVVQQFKAPPIGEYWSHDDDSGLISTHIVFIKPDNLSTVASSVNFAATTSSAAQSSAAQSENSTAPGRPPSQEIICLLGLDPQLAQRMKVTAAQIGLTYKHYMHYLEGERKLNALKVAEPEGPAKYINNTDLQQLFAAHGRYAQWKLLDYVRLYPNLHEWMIAPQPTKDQEKAAWGHLKPSFNNVLQIYLNDNLITSINNPKINTQRVMEMENTLKLQQAEQRLAEEGQKKLRKQEKEKEKKKKKKKKKAGESSKKKV
ncbi:hypothetical protein BJ165DRAFT_1407282 [Panaeolus papilionaceus]|nr:hypothetical protein BJ165DRAFT_1407282 [Panaeolus papilionaceus]